MTLLSTQTGGDSFKTNTTGLRAITRFDVQKFDERAMIACELDFSAIEAVNELSESIDLDALIEQLVEEKLKKIQQEKEVGEEQTESEVSTETEGEQKAGTTKKK